MAIFDSFIRDHSWPFFQRDTPGTGSMLIVQDAVGNTGSLQGSELEIQGDGGGVAVSLVANDGGYLAIDKPVEVTGAITATSFVGDGTGITGVVAEGSAALAVNNLFTNNSNVFQAGTGATSLVAREGATQGTAPVMQVQTSGNVAKFAVYKDGKVSTTLVDYADNAAAVAGGLAAGDLYHTSGAVKVVV